MRDRIFKPGKWISGLNPSAWTYANWRLFFVIAALWNLGAAIPGILYPELSMKIFYGVDLQDFYAILFYRSFWISVLIFGIGYLMIASAPEKHTGVIIMGIIGKIVVAGVWYYLVFHGQARLMAFFGAAGDSLFTIYFIICLLIGPKGPGSAALHGG